VLMHVNLEGWVVSRLAARRQRIIDEPNTRPGEARTAWPGWGARRWARARASTETQLTMPLKSKSGLATRRVCATL
jgi:hypothetical protein